MHLYFLLKWSSTSLWSRLVWLPTTQWN